MRYVCKQQLFEYKENYKRKIDQPFEFRGGSLN